MNEDREIVDEYIKENLDEILTKINEEQDDIYSDVSLIYLDTLDENIKGNDIFMYADKINAKTVLDYSVSGVSRCDSSPDTRIAKVQVCARFERDLDDDNPWRELLSNSQATELDVDFNMNFGLTKDGRGEYSISRFWLESMCAA